MNTTAVRSAKSRLTEEADALREKLRLRGGLWDDEKYRLQAFEDVLLWMDEEAEFLKSEQEASAKAIEEAVQAERPEVKHQETRAVFDSYREKMKARR